MKQKHKHHSRSIAGIIFDMDGVLCDSEPFICEAACRMFREKYEIKAKPEDFKPFVGTGENRYLSGVAEKYGVRLNIIPDKKLTYQIYLELIKGRLHNLPGVTEFVNQCRKCGLKLAVATSADRIKLIGNLHEIRLPQDLFDALITGSEVKRKKPAPDIFLFAASKIQIPAEQCLVIEDSPSGIKAAKKAGMYALGLTTSFKYKDLSEAGADFSAGNLADIHAETMSFIMGNKNPNDK